MTKSKDEEWERFMHEYAAYLVAHPNYPDITVDIISGKVSENDKHIEELWDTNRELYWDLMQHSSVELLELGYQETEARHDILKDAIEKTHPNTPYRMRTMRRLGEWEHLYLGENINAKKVVNRLRREKPELRKKLYVWREGGKSHYAPGHIIFV